MGDTMYILGDDQCPYCGHIVDRVMVGPDTPDVRPLPGDVTVCIQCASPMIFGDNLKLRAPDAEELLEISVMPEVLTVVQAIVSTRRKDS